MSFEPPNDTSDADLFLRLQSGQRSILRTLYDRHAPLVYGIALKLLGNRTEAEDLTQDVFLILAKSTYDPRRGTLRTYLAILTRSRAIDRLRSRRRKQSQLHRQSIAESVMVLHKSPLEDIARLERPPSVKSALEQLSTKEQEVLTMAYDRGLSQSEIAKQLGLDVGTVKSRSRRGLLKLRQALIALRRE